jgi:hypothetical protein
MARRILRNWSAVLASSFFLARRTPSLVREVTARYSWNWVLPPWVRAEAEIMCKWCRLLPAIRNFTSSWRGENWILR